MADRTNIEYCDATWNPATGCTPASEGCDNCWARRMATRLRGRAGYPADDPFRPTWHADRVDAPLHWRKPRVIAVGFMGDLFHEDQYEVASRHVLDIARETPRHTYLLLTKRPHIAAKRLLGTNPPGNVWIGVTAETQATYWARLHHLRVFSDCAWNTWLSLEPLLGPVDLDGLEGVDQVVLGGESGPGSRTMRLDWARSVRDQCKDAGVPFYFKQWGDWAPPCQLPDGEARRSFEWQQGSGWGRFPEPYAFIEPRRFGKRCAGRLLDGRTHDDLAWRA